MAFIQIAQDYTNTVLVGIAILFFGFSAGLLVKKLGQRLLQEIRFNRYMVKVGVSYNLEGAISGGTAYLVYLLTIIFFLKTLKIHQLVLYTIVGAVLLLAGLSFLVWLKEALPNLAGWHALLRRQAQAGQRVVLPSAAGRIIEIGYFETKIKTERGETLYVPNALFLSQHSRS